MFATPKRQSWIANQPKRFSSAVLFLETEGGELLVVRSDYKPYWTLPGGVIDPGETPKQGVIRETHEEIGVDVAADDVSFVAVIDRRSEVAESYQFVFKASLTEVMIRQISLQEAEIAEYALVTKQQILASDRPYAKAALHWANDTMGYIEQTFEGE